MTAENKYKFIMRAFRASDERELCLEYIKGHVQVLTDYGITNVTSNTEDWIDSPYMYCVVVETEEKELVGGIRIQVSEGLTPLPVEGAIGYLDPNIYEKVKHYAFDGGVGELCGLWVSKKLKGLAMSKYLVRASISSTNQLKSKIMTGICAGYTLQMFRNAGFVIDKSLGDGGDFAYPNDEYIANVVGILNAKTLETADDHDKEIMLSLRSAPKQKRIEKETGTPVEIDYNLIYDVVTPIIEYGDFEYQKKLKEV